MKSTFRFYVRAGFVFCALAVSLGAFGSHTLRDLIDSYQLGVFETGVKYQFFHAIAIIMLAFMHRRMEEKYLKLALLLFFVGIIIFSGSLYLLSTRNIWGDDSFNFLGAITPIGGVAFIAGWLLLFFLGVKRTDEVGVLEENHDKKKHRHHHHHSSNTARADETKTNA